MRRKLYLHIGVHRTGTTSIQRFLRGNTAALGLRGVLNPDGRARHHLLAGRILGGQLDAVVAELNAQADAVAGGPVGTIVLSDEDLCTRTDMARLARLSEHFDVRVILFIRRQDLWLESWYRQNVKWQWNRDLAHLTFPEFLARRRTFFWIDYDATVTRLEQLFGAAAVEVLVFEAAAMPGGPVAAFARAIGLDSLEGLVTGQHDNASRTALTTEFMRQLPLDEFPDRSRRLVEEACAKVDWHVRQHYGAQSPYYMDAATRAAVMADHAPGNAALAQRRFGRAALFADPLPPADAALAPTALPDDAAALMQVFVAPMLRHLIARGPEKAATEDAAVDEHGPD